MGKDNKKCSNKKCGRMFSKKKKNNYVMIRIKMRKGMFKPVYFCSHECFNGWVKDN